MPSQTATKPQKKSSPGRPSWDHGSRNCKHCPKKSMISVLRFCSKDGTAIMKTTKSMIKIRFFASILSYSRRCGPSNSSYVHYLTIQAISSLRVRFRRSYSSFLFFILFLPIFLSSIYILYQSNPRLICLQLILNIINYLI